MEIEYSPEAKDDLIFWKKSGNKPILKRIRSLLESIQDNPYEGIGKPELLRFDLSGKWSRRITETDRIVYEVFENRIIIHSLRGHYKKL
jgi:toxin YoeB